VYKNVASLERVLRVFVGLVFLFLAVAGPRTPWGLLGLVPLITGASGHCPFYALLRGLSQTFHHRHAH
jgi:hypothetical protein